MRETLSILDEYTPGIEHSENDDGSTVYDTIGKDCKDPLKSGILIDYVFKEGTPNDIIRQAKDGVKDIVEKMETSGERVTKRILMTTVFHTCHAFRRMKKMIMCSYIISCFRNTS